MKGDTDGKESTDERCCLGVTVANVLRVKGGEASSSSMSYTPTFEPGTALERTEFGTGLLLRGGVGSLRCDACLESRMEEGGGGDLAGSRAELHFDSCLAEFSADDTF